MANILDLLFSWKRTVKLNDNISRLYMLYQALIFASSILGPATIVLMLTGAFNNVSYCNGFLVGCFIYALDSFYDRLLDHMAQIVALGFGFYKWRNLFYRRKTLLVVGWTRTQVLAGSMVIAANVLNHCTT